MGDFRQLKAWQEAKRLAILSRELIEALPRSEAFALAAQWRRAAYSVPLNIAEGATQSSWRQFRRYLDIAKGSLDEMEALFELVEGLGYASSPQLREVRLARTHCVRLVTGLAQSVSGNASSDNRQRSTRQRLNSTKSAPEFADRRSEARHCRSRA